MSDKLDQLLDRARGDLKGDDAKSLEPAGTADVRARREGIAGILLGTAALVTAIGTAVSGVLRPKEDRSNVDGELGRLKRRIAALEEGRRRVYVYELELRDYLAGVLGAMGVKVHSQPAAPRLEPVEILPAPMTTSVKPGAPLVQPGPAIPTPPSPEDDG